MSDDIKAAARNSMLRAAKAVKVLHVADEPEFAAMASTQAAIRLADVVLATEAAREAEAAERAKGITEEWLLSIGFVCEMENATKVFTLDSDWHQVQIKSGKVLLVDRQGTFIQLGLALTTTRGTMLDLLAVLKIPTKEQS